MPIPLLFIGAAAVSGAFGLGKTVQASADQKEAQETHNRAERYINEAKGKIEICRTNCGDALDNLGRRKIQILDESIKPFIQEFEKLNHVELSESKGLNELQKMVLDKKEFSQLKDLQSFATSLVGGLATGAMAGTLTAFGAFGAAGVLASASTGTAIATLHGAAAMNATLAFFGGGAIAAGGLGMTAGTYVLGGLVAGPALAVLGVVAGARASANKDAAYSDLAKAKAFKAEMDAAAAACIGIRKRANMFSRFLLSMNSIFEPLIFEMQQIIKNSGTDYRTFSIDEKKTIAEAMAIAGAIKAILDTPILDDDGNLTKESEIILEKTTNQLHGKNEPYNESKHEKECTKTDDNNKETGVDSRLYSDNELTILDIIKRHIKKIAKSSSAKPYIVSEFDPFDERNEKRLDKALSKYAKKVRKDEAIAFIDISFFEDGGDGILFSEHGISFDWAFEKVYAKYNEISRTEIINRGKALALYGHFSERKDNSSTPTISNIYFDLDELKQCLDEIIAII